jgi:Bacillus/Clostridium GerA spore germination protein.
MGRRACSVTIGTDLAGDIQTSLASPPDLVCRTLITDADCAVQCIYLDSIVDKKTIDDFIVNAVRQNAFAEQSASSGNRFMRELPFTTPYDTIREQAVQAVIAGQCVLVDAPRERVCIIDAAETPNRPVEEPMSEPTIRGSHEGFTEDVRINVGLIRKRIRNASLRFESMTIGSRTNTIVVLVYLENLAPDQLVREMRRRLSAIRTDSLLESSYVEEFIQDRILSPFPTLLNTERPDKVAAHLLEGKAAVMVDGTPYVLVAPLTFFELFNATEDYYQRADIATFIRWLRFVSFFVAVFTPALYVAVTTFHQELIPTELLISLSAQREGVPLPAFLEIMLMEIVFEIIREAGLRMPRAVGQALSIVGAIVLGQAAVEAGLISAAVVIVVAVTGITNFVVPVYSFGMSQRLLRFTFLLLAGFLGLFGILCGALLLIAHLVTLKSFGVPYLTPLSPASRSDWRDVLVRAPRPWLNPERLPAAVRRLKRK